MYLTFTVDVFEDITPPSSMTGSIWNWNGEEDFGIAVVLQGVRDSICLSNPKA